MPFRLQGLMGEMPKLYHITDADLLEQFLLELRTNYEHYWMDSIVDGVLTINDEPLKVFLKYCEDKVYQDLHTPRSKDKKSFYQRRQESWWLNVN